MATLKGHRSARIACHIHRRRRIRQPIGRHSRSNRASVSHSAGRRRGPPRARGRRAQRARESGAARGRRGKESHHKSRGTRRGSSHGRHGRRESSSHSTSSTPGAARGKPGSQSQIHRNARQHNRQHTKLTASRESADKRTKAGTGNQGRAAHTPKDRENTNHRPGAHNGRTLQFHGFAVGPLHFDGAQLEDRRLGQQALKAGGSPAGGWRAFDIRLFARLGAEAAGRAACGRGPERKCLSFCRFAASLPLWGGRSIVSLPGSSRPSEAI